jgi:hypothetical protein
MPVRIPRPWPRNAVGFPIVRNSTALRFLTRVRERLYASNLSLRNRIPMETLKFILASSFFIHADIVGLADFTAAVLLVWSSSPVLRASDLMAICESFEAHHEVADVSLPSFGH